MLLWIMRAILALVIAGGLALFGISGGEVLTRTLSATVAITIVASAAILIASFSHNKTINTLSSVAGALLIAGVLAMQILFALIVGSFAP